MRWGAPLLGDRVAPRCTVADGLLLARVSRGRVASDARVALAPRSPVELPDGFPVEAIETYARSCVYMTVLRNDAAPGVVDFRLADWTVDSGAERRPPVDLDSWLQRLQPFGLGKAALIGRTSV